MSPKVSVPRVDGIGKFANLPFYLNCAKPLIGISLQSGCFAREMPHGRDDEVLSDSDP